MPDILFPYDTNSNKWAGNVQTDHGTGVISIVGLVTTEVVKVEIPRVVYPDINNDNHWTPLVQNGVNIELKASHNAEKIIGNLYIRISKPTGVSGNTYTVRFG